MSGNAPLATAPAGFRRALGHYPTGVSLITARQADGTPVAMVVGTFTSVSLDPPLVGFLPDRASTSWPLIREAGRFCVNVLAADQEQVCRAFVSKDPDRFERWTSVGDVHRPPLLRGAVLQVDCDLADVLPAGDHDVVLGRVTGISVSEEAGLPLLFLRGGYGSPSLPSVQAEGPGLADQLRLADLIRPEAEALSAELGLVCLVSAAVGDAVVSLVAAGIGSAPGGSDTRVGTTFPLAAPIAPLFLAWAPAADQQAWLARGARLTGSDTAGCAADLAAVRALGHTVTTGRASADRFERSLFDRDAPGGVAGVLGELLQRGPEPGLRRPLAELTDVTSIAAPVRDRDGQVVLALHLMGFTGQETPDRLTTCLDRLLVAARRATDRTAA
ncbi:flavin reductase [Modestobacter sp. VKM Ac-2986]|uniref:flavin reductase n=1 Tax=Modestobacter sp. VKM Ac-2986 TaxID=3004140 RepID=UPI0022AA2C8C|nr:flavin reductase [Modestobacter sp. VKM Ac-2986]MCZ2828816.1 flavin reductase [Modestobacter sp. VKM Ac-2986]